MTAQDAAEASRAHDGRGVSAAYWRDIERGYGGRRGKRVPTRASDRALAAMARVVGVTPAQLADAGRGDAARVLQESLRRDAHTAEPDDLGLLPTTEAMERAIRVHMQEVNDRLEFVRRRFPGQRLTGAMMFPTAPRDQQIWDGLVADGESEEATAQGIAAIRAWRQGKATAAQGGTVTEFVRRA